MQTFYTVMNMLPEWARDRAVIAGGWAACPELAGDIDVWILGCETTEMSAPFNTDEQSVIWRLYQYFVDERHYVTRHAFAPEYAIPETGVQGYVSVKGTRSPGAVPGLWQTKLSKQPLQILPTRIASAQALIDAFDISTHSVAQIDGGRFLFGERYTSTRQTPRVLHFNRPANTLERLLKVCKRYGLEPDPAEVAELERRAECEAVVDGLAA